MTVTVFAIIACLTHPSPSWPADQVCRLLPATPAFLSLEDCQQWIEMLPTPPITHTVFCVRKEVAVWEPA